MLDSSTYGYNRPASAPPSPTPPAPTLQYSYDNIGQIKVAASSSTIENLGYAYDAAWNVSYTTNNGDLGTDYVDIKNELTNDPNSYFAGLRRQRKLRHQYRLRLYSYTCDAENRLSLIIRRGSIAVTRAGLL